MSDAQKRTNEVSYHRSLSDLREIIRDTQLILYRFIYFRKILLSVDVKF